MSANVNAEDLPRRRFLKLSGVAGAAAVLCNFGTAAEAAAPTILQAAPCGDPSSKDSLWVHANSCHGKQPSAYCMGVNNAHNDVVIEGAQPPGSHNFLLVPTVRVNGIECPDLLGGLGEPLWEDAWQQAQPSGATPVTFSGGPLGLGVNARDNGGQPAKPIRKHDQLHIHMAGISNAVVAQLNQAGVKKNDLNGWKGKLVKITSQGFTYNYRTCELTSLKQNLFKLLHDHVVSPNKEDMAIQMMVVTKSPGGWYVLNSNSKLPGQGTGVGGTSTCDRLLFY